jgi:1-acyl-sn-glycerol-3-phosphate acyltransferase
MVLPFTDVPYQFLPSRRSRLICWLGAELGRRWILPKQHRVTEVEVVGVDSLKGSLRPGDRLMFTPNHPTHSDPLVMVETLRRLRVPSEFMTAWEVFVRSRKHRWLLPRIGCFSIDRWGLDSQAIKHASEVLLQGRHSLVVFPEGNVFLQNDLVSPFNEGAAFFAMRTAKELAETGQRVLIVPVSIKFTYVENVWEAVRNQVRMTAAKIGVSLESNPCPLAHLRMIGLSALRRNQKMRGLEVTSADNPRDAISHAVTNLLERLEAKVELPQLAEATLLERVCRVQRAAQRVRTDPERKFDHAAAGTWADEALLAFKILSYLGDYVHRHPTLDRYAETVEKLNEDLHGETYPAHGSRKAYVRLGEPIVLMDYLGGRLRDNVSLVTATCQNAVQNGIDQINQTLQHVGSSLITEPQSTRNAG